MAIKTYRVDFYQISLQPTANLADPEAGLKDVATGVLASTHNDGSHVREIYGLEIRPNARSIGGRFRKFRTADLPEIGSVGEPAEEIILAGGQGLIEQNFFVWYREHNVLAWHVNGHASPPARFQAFLSHIWGTQVRIDPIIQADAIRRLMSGDVEVKKLKLTLPKPTNPELFPNDNYSPHVLKLMNQSGADSIHIEMGVNLKLNPQGGLGEGVKAFLRSITSMGATTARAIVEGDADGIHPIDLVADRVFASIASDSNSRFPLPATMYQLIDGAHRDCQEAINDYFGSVEGALR